MIKTFKNFDISFFQKFRVVKHAFFWAFFEKGGKVFIPFFYDNKTLHPIKSFAT